jgi:diguanylate cyclase (GGDEF)-like protein
LKKKATLPVGKWNSILVKLHITRLPKLIAQRRSSAILGTIIIAMLWGGIAMKYFESVRADLSEADRTNKNFAMIFEENVLRSLSEVDKAVLYLRHSVEVRKDNADYNTIIQTTDVLSDLIVQAGIVDSKGIIRASTAGPQPNPPLDVSDREHFRVQMGDTKDLLFISKPVIGRASEQWSVQLSRRFNNADGSFGGIIVASLNPVHFTTFYNEIDFGADASIAMIGSDGVVRSSGGSAIGRFTLGQNLTGTALFQHMQQGRDSVFEYTDAANREPLLMALRHVHGYPVWVSVGVRKSDVLQASWASLRSNTLIGIVLTLITLGAMEQILRSEAAAAQKANHLDLTLDHINQGIMLVTEDLHIPIINKRCGELLGLPEELVNHPPRFDELSPFQSTNDRRVPSLEFGMGVAKEWKDAASEFVAFEHTRSDGAVIEVHSTPLPAGGFVRTFTDVTKRSQAEAHIARLASEDPLTGLPNRRVFRSTIDRLSGIESSAEDTVAASAEFAVLFLDLDRFKVINDTLGHRLGDMLLIEVARRLKHTLRPGEMLARLGGDEFAVVLPSFDSRDALGKVAGAIVEAVACPYGIDGHNIRSAVSIGIAIAPGDGKNADELLMAADLALYAVKNGGRGTYRFYKQSMNEEINYQRQIELDLREAIEQNQLHLEYQPIIDMRRNVVSGFEALARWQHPIKGSIPPAVFIPIAEDSGLIVPLGEWALREACTQATRWPNDLKIAVNLSPLQFSLSNLVDTISRVVTETTLGAHRLVLEITEGLFISETAKTQATLHRLKALGVRIAMDDFGTGYSSLSSLRSFPFDEIKIDRAFVSDLGKNSESSAIIQAVIIIASAMGMTTVAEGVETADQQMLLKTLGCDEVQGYLYGCSVAVEEVPKFIASWECAKAGKIMAA